MRNGGNLVNERLREEIALFRHGVIRDFVADPLAKGEKQRLLDELAERDWEIPGTRRRTIGRTTLRDWIALHKAMGFEGLKPRRRQDAGTSRAIPDSVADLLLAVKAERPKATVTSVIRALRLSGKVDPDLPLAASTVHRLFAAHGFGRSAKPDASGEPDARAFTHPHAGDLWMSDIMHGPRLQIPGRTKGQKTYLYGFLDDATRMVPFSAFYVAENAACFQNALKEAILRRGVPRRLYCDNGATYRTHHLRVICATLNITLIHSRPYRPRGRGKIERFFRTVRSAFLPHVTPDHLADLATLNRVWWAWIECEYHQTSHGGIGRKTPLERFCKDEALIRPAPDDLDDLMRMVVTRVVGRDRTIRLNGRLLECPDGYAGEKVDVLFDPYDLSRPIHMRRLGESEEIPLRKLDLVANAELKRAAREHVEGDTPVPTGIRYLDLVADRFYDGEQ